MEILIKAAQLILSLSILVLVHEFGHFIFARLFKVRVDKFYLFFDIKFSLFKFKPKNSDTEYGVGWLPLGGYCKIAGMIDESMDAEQLAQEPQPWEFRTKPAWQRLLIMVGGAAFNIILAFLIYSATLFVWGDTYIANEDVEHGIAYNSIADQMGFKVNDKILAINGQAIERFENIQKEMLYGGQKITIERNGIRQDITVDPSDYLYNLAKEPVFKPSQPFVIEQVNEDSQNVGANLANNDIVVGVNGKPMLDFEMIKHELGLYKNKEVNLLVKKGSDTLEVPVLVDSSGLMNISVQAVMPRITTLSYNFFESIPAGVKKTGLRIKDQIRDLKVMPKIPKSTGSLIAIASIYKPTWDWKRFWDITVLLSVMLAVINLLPIPALDGGHVMFLLYEVITRRKPSEKFLGYAQMVGMVLLLALMVFALGNDIFRFIISK